MRAVPSAASQDLVRPNGLLPMTSFIDPKTLKSWLHDGGEIALLDVREHGQYGEAHLFYGIPLPFSRLVCLILLRGLVIALVTIGAKGNQVDIHRRTT